MVDRSFFDLTVYVATEDRWRRKTKTWIGLELLQVLLLIFTNSSDVQRSGPLYKRESVSKTYESDADYIYFSPPPSIYNLQSIYAHTSSIYNLGAKQFDLATGKGKVGHADFLHVQDATPVRRGGTNSSSTRLHLRRRPPPAVTCHPTATVSP
jgi:hypothetical protein